MGGIMNRSILLVLCGVFSATPVFGQSAAERQLAADIRILDQRTNQIEVAIAELAEAVEGLSKQLAEQANVTRKLSADQTVLLREALAAVSVLKEQVAATNQQLTTVLEKSTSPSGAPGLFETARADYMAGNYSLAVQGFAEYLNRSPEASNAAQAQYYMGEAYRQDGNLNEALNAYDRLIAQYSTSDQIPIGRVRRAEVLTALGRVKEAAADYESVLKDAPNTDAASLAKQRLAALGR
jgi:TolA-binding protein